MRGSLPTTVLDHGYDVVVGAIVVTGAWVVGGSVTGGLVVTGAVVGAAVAGGVVAMVPPDDPELDDPGATWVLPSDSMVCLVAPSTFCSVTAHCASMSL